MREARGVCSRHRCNDPENEKKGDISRRAPEVDSSPAEPRSKEPEENVSRELEACRDYIQLERLLRRDSGLWALLAEILARGESLTLEEESRLIRNQVARKVLAGVHKTNNHGPPQIGALEKIEIGWIPAHSCLKPNSPVYHSELLLCLMFFFIAQSLDRAKRLLGAPVADKPIRRLWREEEENYEGSLGRSAYRSQVLGKIAHRENPL